jgi:hypothetical protein
MAKATHAGTNANCRQCHFRRGVGNRAYKGVRIPDGPGKCVRPSGLCDAKKATLASNQVRMG